MEFEKLYTAEDVAQFTGLTLRTIRNYIKSGKLKGRRIGVQWRFTAADIQALFEEPEKSSSAPSDQDRPRTDTQEENVSGPLCVPQETGTPAETGGTAVSETVLLSAEAEEPQASVPRFIEEAAITAEEETESVPETLWQVQTFLSRKKAARPSACAVVDMPGVTEQEARFLFNRLQSLAAVYQDGPKRLELSYQYDENRELARYVFSGAMESVCAMMNLCEVQ